MTTILDLAGIEIPEIMNGKSLAPLLNKPELDFRKDFFMEHMGIIDVENHIPDSYGVRTKNWKYIRYVNSETETEDIFYLKDDPMEMNSLTNDPEYLDTKDYLRNLCDDYINNLNSR